MILAIDIGNTNVALAGVDGDNILFSGKVKTNREWDKETYLPLIEPILENIGTPEGAILSSVVPQVTGPVAESVEEITGLKPIIVGKDTDYGLQIDVYEPDKVGRDRLVDACWAANNLPLPAVTADLGTATTLNVILPGKIFAGGVICTGIQTGLNALAWRAAQLPKLELKIPENIIGKNTEECMLSGAVAGTAGMLDGLVASIEAEIGSPVSMLITGGGGEYVSPLVRHPHVFDKHALLKGLVLLYERNKQKSE